MRGLRGMARSRENRPQRGASGRDVFFIFLGISAATGGTVHGFFPDAESPGCQFLWQLTLQAIGLAAFATWNVGAGILATGRLGRWLALAGVPLVVLYSAAALLITQEFWIALTIYLPGVLLLLTGFCRAAGRNQNWFLLVGAAGSGLSLVSSLIQFTRLGINPDYLNHNALAHVVQAIALALIYRGIRHVTGSEFIDARTESVPEFLPTSG